jgi:hypothetical protein
VHADKDVEQFIVDIIDSLIMWELVAFLWNNPGITDNAEGIAGRLGRRSQDLVQPLESLVSHGVLQKWGEAAEPIYAYHPSTQLAKAIDKFMHFNNSKQGKLLIWSQLLKHGMR